MTALFITGLLVASRTAAMRYDLQYSLLQMKVALPLSHFGVLLGKHLACTGGNATFLCFPGNYLA